MNNEMAPTAITVSITKAPHAAIELEIGDKTLRGERDERDGEGALDIGFQIIAKTIIINSLNMTWLYWPSHSQVIETSLVLQPCWALGVLAAHGLPSHFRFQLNAATRGSNDMPIRNIDNARASFRQACMDRQFNGCVAGSRCNGADCEGGSMGSGEP